MNRKALSIVLTAALLANMVPAAPAFAETQDPAPTTQAEVQQTADVHNVVNDQTVWKYLDNNTDPAGDASSAGYDRTAWTKADFDDSQWKQAAGPFGSKRGGSHLEDGYDAKTVLDGCDGSNDTPAYFFRTNVNLTADDLKDKEALTGILQYDDAAIVYVNGVKVAGYDDGSITANLQHGGSNAGTPQEVTFEVPVSAVHEGANTIAVELHNGRPASSDVWLNVKTMDLGKSSIPAQSNVVLSMGADQTSMNLTWQSNSIKGQGKVYYEPTADMENYGQYFSANVKTVQADQQATQATGVVSNKATLTDLKPDTAYTYCIVNGDNAAYQYHEFKTGDSDAFSFAYVGDPQIGASGNAANDTQGWDKTLQVVEDNKIFDDTDFIFSAGDQINNSVGYGGDVATEEGQYDGYLDHDLLAEMPNATIIGNHDSNGVGYGQHFNIANESDQYGQTNAGADSWYVYDNTLFLNLNSNDMSTAEHKAFMEQAIAQAAKNYDIKWKVATLHHSIYSTATHMTDQDIVQRRNELAPVFKDLDIDVVLQGHDHVYTRSYMMDGLNPITTSDKYEYGNGADQAPTAVNDPDGVL